MTAKASKKKKRTLILGFVCLVVNFLVFYSLATVWKDITEKRLEKEALTSELASLKEEEKQLKSEVNKLNDPTYIARYAREKFLYSGKNEYILKIE